MWDGVRALLPIERWRAWAPDLPGHGAQAQHLAPLSFPGCAAQLLEVAPESFTLCGYSMGGRLALHVALAAPERVSRLVLVSTAAGIEDPAERERRRLADRELADCLELSPFEDFVERWSSQPLFVEDPPAVLALAREDQLRNKPAALAAVLRGLGSGEMEPLWDRLAELRMPSTVVVGERDRRYMALGRRMAAALPVGELVVVPGGHRLALESPRAIAQVLTALPKLRGPGPSAPR